jgi:peptidyl-dipeptidase A
MLALGQSQPWPQTLAVFTGETRADAGGVLDYFAPLNTWLVKQNKGEKCGW